MATARRRFDKDDLGIAAWEAVLRTRAALVPLMAGDVEEATGLPLSWYDVLLELSSAGGPLRMRELGDRVVLSRTRVSRIVGRMLEEQLLERRPDPADGRATQVSMTPAGRRALHRAAPVYLATIDRYFSNHLGVGEAEAIVTGLGRVLSARNEDDTP